MSRFGQRSEPLDWQPDPELLTALAALRDGGRDPARLTAGRAAVIAAAARAREAGIRRPVRWRRRLAAGLLGATGVAALSGGAVAASANALPDSPLYGVKRAAEAIELRFTFDDQSRGRLELEFAERRAAEAVAMAQSGHTDLALQAVRDGQSDLDSAAADLRGHEGAENEQALQHASDVALPRLTEVFDRLAAAGQADAAQAVRHARDHWRQQLDAEGATDTNGPAEATETPAPGQSGAAGGAGQGQGQGQSQGAGAGGQGGGHGQGGSSGAKPTGPPASPGGGPGH